jgi:hypothetical protein
MQDFPLYVGTERIRAVSELCVLPETVWQLEQITILFS